MTSSQLAGLHRAATTAGSVLAGITEQDWARPTPCGGWDVAALVDHLLGGNWACAAAVSARLPEQQAVGRERVPAADVRSAGAVMADYRASIAALEAAFGEPGALERPVTIPFGTVPGDVALHLRLVELLVHGWDVAQATGQRVAFPEDLAEAELSFSRAAMGQLPASRKPFADPQQAPAEAPAIDRLAALLGRPVTTQVRPG